MVLRLRCKLTLTSRWQIPSESFHGASLRRPQSWAGKSSCAAFKARTFFIFCKPCFGTWDPTPTPPAPSAQLSSTCSNAPQLTPSFCAFLSCSAAALHLLLQTGGASLPLPENSSTCLSVAAMVSKTASWSTSLPTMGLAL